MMARYGVRGFSMVEVIIAVGVFAVTVVAILGLISAMVRPGGESADWQTAQRLAGPVEAELRRLAAPNFGGLATAVPVMSAPLQNGFTLVATRDGLRLHADQSGFPVSGAEIAQDERYFLIEAWQFNEAPLRYTGDGLLALHVRISWPYIVPGAAMPTPVSDRSQLGFTISLIR